MRASEAVNDSLVTDDLGRDAQRELQLLDPGGRCDTDSSDALEEKKMIQMTRDEYNEYCRCVQLGDTEAARVMLKALEHRDKIDRMVSAVYVGETICKVFDEYGLPDEPRVKLLEKVLKEDE